MIRNLLTTLFFVTAGITCTAQRIVSFGIDVSKPMNEIDVPASINLDALTFVPDSLLTLVEINGTTRTEIPFQITQGKNRMLHWVIRTGNNAASKRSYELTKSKTPTFDRMKAEMKDGSLTIHAKGKNLLRYWYQTVYPP
ncbi:MAG: PmoA family protein, partial [Flavisolibacter sp.]